MARLTIEDRYDAAVAGEMITLANQMPGLSQYLGLTLQRFEPGRLWSRADLSSHIPTVSGNVHGGVLAAIMDHVTGAVIYPLIPAGYWGATTELKLNYIAPVSPGPLDIESSVIAITTRSAVVRAEAYVDGQIVCACQGTISIIAPRTPGPG